MAVFAALFEIRNMCGVKNSYDHIFNFMNCTHGTALRLE